MTTTAIIGAGIAGLACARRLRIADREVVLFDKGRSVGGRMATRRVETPAGQAQFDHGAQFFTARDPDFRTEVASVAANGYAALWQADFAMLTSSVPSPERVEDRWVGAPSMSAFAKAMAQGLDVRTSMCVTEIIAEGPTWRLAVESGEPVGPFEAVIVATPAEQAAPLLATIAPALAAEAVAAVK